MLALKQGATDKVIPFLMVSVTGDQDTRLLTPYMAIQKGVDWDTRLPSSVRPKNCWRNQEMYEDPIVEEVRAARQEYARQFGYDLHAICEDLRNNRSDPGR